MNNKEEREMIIVKLKSFTVANGDIPIQVKYIELLKSAVNIPKEGGFSPTEMQERLKILDALDISINGEIKLEDKDIKLLASLVKEQRFNIVHQGFIDYANYIQKLADDLPQA